MSNTAKPIGIAIPEDVEASVAGLTFVPLHRWRVGGNEHQIARTTFRGVDIYERSFFPFSIFKPLSFHYVVDLILPMTTPVAGGTMENYDLYLDDPDDTVGNPHVRTLEAAVEFIQQYRIDNPE